MGEKNLNSWSLLVFVLFLLKHPLGKPWEFSPKDTNVSNENKKTPRFWHRTITEYVLVKKIICGHLLEVYIRE